MVKEGALLYDRGRFPAGNCIHVNLKRVAVFDFDKKTEADKRATELSKGGKSPHFVQKVKEEIKLE